MGSKESTYSTSGSISDQRVLAYDLQGEGGKTRRQVKDYIGMPAIGGGICFFLEVQKTPPK